MVTLAPPVGAVLPRFLDFARGSVLTAHNAPFDVGFLSAACTGTGRRWPAPPVLDTVTLARLLLTEDEVPNCKLATLADFFGAPATPRHRALADARATAAVLAALLDRLAATGRTDPRPAQRGGAGRRATGRPPISPPPRCRVRSLAAEQRYATPEGSPADGHEEAAGDHRDRAVEGRRGEDPRDSGDSRPDPAGHRGLLGDRGIRSGGPGPGAGARGAGRRHPGHDQPGRRASRTRRPTSRSAPIRGTTSRPRSRWATKRPSPVSPGRAAG